MNLEQSIVTVGTERGLLRCLSALSLGCALAAVGCGQAAPDGATNATNRANTTSASNGIGETIPASGPVTELVGGRIYARLMHAETVEPEHTIEFYEFAPGDYLTREVMSADQGGKLLLDLAGKNATLTQLYKLAVPGSTEADVPEELASADRLVAQRVAAAAVVSKPPAATGSEVGSVSEALNDDPSVPIVIPPPNNGCSPDVLGDNWGAQWFLSNNCAELNFRDCAGNQTFFSIERQTQTFITRQMEGDFYSLGHSHGRTLASTHCEGPWYDPICHYPSWQVAWDFDIQPRQVIGMQSTGGYPSARKAAWGFSECGHGHRAFEWN